MCKSLVCVINECNIISQWEQIKMNLKKKEKKTERTTAPKDNMCACEGDSFFFFIPFSQSLFGVCYTISDDHFLIVPFVMLRHMNIEKIEILYHTCYYLAQVKKSKKQDLL